MVGNSGADAAHASASAALQVIVLGAGGGPQEFNTTAFLVRPTAEGWRRGSIVALDAGVMMGSITRILEKSQPPGLQEVAGSRDSSIDSRDSRDSRDSGASSRASTGSRSMGEAEEDDNDPHNAEARADAHADSQGRPAASIEAKAETLSLPHTMTTGPFAGLAVPHANPMANASYIHNALINTYLITHPHLDHISGFVVNTAGLPGTRPKRLAGLPSTISAFKQHIFNNVIWPNLSDENNGAGLVTYMRLVDGGSPALGDGDGRGYVEISDGLAVKVWGVSHGHCIERHSHRGSGAGLPFPGYDGGASGLPYSPQQPPPPSQQLPPQSYQQQQQHQQQLPQQAQQAQQLQLPPSALVRQNSLAVLSASTPVRRQSQAFLSSAMPSPSESVCVYDSSAYFIRDVATGREVLMFGDVEPDSISLSPRNIHVWQEAAPKIAAGTLAAIFLECSYDDSQPLDRLYGHLTPRHMVEELTTLAAEVEKARITLKKQQEEQQLLKLQQQRDREGRKRKRRLGYGDEGRLSISTGSRQGSHSRRRMDKDKEFRSSSSNMRTPATDDPVSPRTVNMPSVTSSGPAPAEEIAYVVGPTKAAPTQGAAISTPHISTPTADLSLGDTDMPLVGGEGGEGERDDMLTSSGAPGGPKTNKDLPPAPPAQPAPSSLPSDPQLPLEGLKIVVIHIKEKLKDGPTAGEIILEQLLDYEEQSPLGCEYIISHAGQSLYF